MAGTTSQTSPAMGLSMAVPYAALPVGGVLIALHFLAALGAPAPDRLHDPVGDVSLVLAVAFVVFLLANVPIALSLGGAAVLALLWEGHIPLLVVPQRIFTGSDSFPLLAIPLFILAGELMEHSGISERLVRLAQVLVGWLRGGLGMTVVVAEIFFSGISGSTVADTSALGTTMIPAMRRAGYTAPRAAAIVSAASGMGILVPPCINMVVYGIMAQVSIAALFAAGFLPAFVMAAVPDGAALARRRAAIPLLVVPARPTGREALVPSAAPSVPLLMPVLIFGGILTGVFTATEAGAVAVAYGLLVGVVIYRVIDRRRHVRDPARDRAGVGPDHAAGGDGVALRLAAVEPARAPDA